MSKKIGSILVILITILSVYVMLSGEEIDFNNIKSKGIEVISEVKSFSFKNLSKEKMKETEKSQEQIKSNSETVGKNSEKQNANSKDQTKTTSNANLSKNTLPKDKIITQAMMKYKKDKEQQLYESYKEDRDVYYETKINEQKALAKTKETVNEEKETSVFKVSKEETKNKLTLSDKQKILSVASKLSPTDYNKINGYLKSNDEEQGVISSIKLLRDRLSDKDYEKVKEVADKFLNMDVIEDKGKE